MTYKSNKLTNIINLKYTMQCIRYIMYQAQATRIITLENNEKKIIKTRQKSKYFQVLKIRLFKSELILIYCL